MVSRCVCVVLIARSGLDCMRDSVRVVELLPRTVATMCVRVLNIAAARAQSSRLASLLRAPP